jgi:leader peptidase (prepilin peptidase)/N-methyltransferase
MLVLIFVLGLIFGSFISALSYRLPLNKDFVKDRSRCPKCKNVIAWYDNIPFFSYLLLKGKCRNCHKHISLRYPLTEVITSLIFAKLFLITTECNSLNSWIAGSPVCLLNKYFSGYALPYLYFISIILITIFIIDLEKKLILDQLVFSGIAVTTLVLVFISPNVLYLNFFSAFAAALFLLFLNLITKGKGMGLGDVKFALLIGLIIGGKYTLIWMFLSFLIGAIVGLILIFFKKAEIGRKIPFAPFMVISFYLTLIIGGPILTIFFPFL